MKSAVAELIGAFLEAGGTITRCPDGIGLGDPVLVERSRPGQFTQVGFVVGAAEKVAGRRGAVCSRVTAALFAARAPLTLLGIEAATGLSFHSVRGAVQDLVDSGAITITSRGQRGTRWFAITPANTGTGDMAGVPASVEKSAAGACAGLSSLAARPGKAA